MELQLHHQNAFQSDLMAENDFFVESLSRIAVAPLRVLIAQLSMEKAAATNVSETVPKFLASIGFYFACTV